MSARDDLDERPVLITGGAGFIGANLAHRLLQAGERVILFDNLARPSVARNVEWLERQHGGRVKLVLGDVRDAARVAQAALCASHVFHFAAQVAVTRSLEDPAADFDINARGTLNVLEALRSIKSPPPLVFTSTNKVYGALTDLRLRSRGKRVELEDPALAEYGISEARPLDFHSPYGCSKGAADQYVLDYVRSYGIPAVVFRMSCIYGPRQFGNEDQGWVAHFLIRALERAPITIYGSGAQVRDLLFVDDLVDALLTVRSRPHVLAGLAFNVGGGPENTLSLLELIDLIEALDGRRPEVTFSAPRTGDQRYYVSDTTLLSSLTGWAPRVRVRDGVAQLYTWLREGASRGAPPLAVPRLEPGAEIGEVSR